MVYKKSDKTEARKDEKRRLIFGTAAKVFAQNGYHQTSVKNICDAAEISVGTFYLYFKNKEDLFEELYDEMEKIINDVNKYAVGMDAKTAAERFAHVVAASIWTYQKYRELAKILLIEAVGLNPRFEDKYTNIMLKSCATMEDTLKKLKDKGFIDVPDVKVAAIAHEGAFNHAIAYWLRVNEELDLKVYAYPLTVYSLQALKMDFRSNDIQYSINETFEELENSADKFMKFR